MSIKELKFWCQKVLPLVYDDSLSYYELLCKIVAKLNEVINSQNDLVNKFENNLYETVNNILTEWKNDGTLNTILTEISQSVINAVICGIDNTGSTDCGNDITNLLNKFTGRTIYFPAGTYKINTSVIMRTDDSYKGNILWCDSDATFITDGISTMFILGNSSEASSLKKFGFEGGHIIAKNVTETVIKINNKQYSFIAEYLLITECGDVTAIQIGGGQTSSSQAYLSNITITGDGSVKGTGIDIDGTDNYLININIGRMKHNLILSGGGNVISNLHTWNYGTEYQNLGIVSPEEKLNYASITISGSNTFSNTQIDNGTPAINLTNNAVHNVFNGITFNYEEDFPWATTNDQCCCVNVTGQQITLGNSFEINGIVFNPRTSNKVRLIKFFQYDRNVVFPLGFSWSAKYIATREAKLRALECDFGRTIYEPELCVTNYFNVSDTAKCFLVGYIGLCIPDMLTKYKFYDISRGEVECDIINDNGNITINSKLINNFSDSTKLLFGSKTEVINGYTVIPIYYKAETSGKRYNGLIVEPIKTPDILNSFVPMRLPEWIDIPSNIIEVDCYAG